MGTSSKTHFIGSLIAAFVFTYISIGVIGLVAGTFLEGNPVTLLEWMSVFLLGFFALAIVLFTVALYCVVIKLILKELHNQPPTPRSSQPVSRFRQRQTDQHRRVNAIHQYPPRSSYYRQTNRWHWLDDEDF